KAQNEFKQIATTYPQFKGVQPYLDYATTQAKIEKAPQTQSTPHPQQLTQTTSISSSIPWIIIGVGVVLLATLLLFGVIVFRRRLVKRTPPAKIPPTSSKSSTDINHPLTTNRCRLYSL